MSLAASTLTCSRLVALGVHVIKNSCFIAFKIYYNMFISVQMVSMQIIIGRIKQEILCCTCTCNCWE